LSETTGQLIPPEILACRKIFFNKFIQNFAIWTCNFEHPYLLCRKSEAFCSKISAYIPRTNQWRHWQYADLIRMNVSVAWCLMWFHIFKGAYRANEMNWTEI